MIGQAARLHLGPAGRTLIAIATGAILVGAVLAGCAVSPRAQAGRSRPTTLPVRSDRLVVLAGTVGSMRLFSPGPTGDLEPTGGLRPPSNAPAPVGGTGLPATAAWLSSSGRDLVVTTLGGATWLTSDGTPGWHEGAGDLAGPHPGRAFGSADPGTDRVAFVEGDPGAGTTGRLVVETILGRLVRRFDLSRPPESAPAWLSDGRIVVIVRDQDDEPRPVIADPTTGRLTVTTEGPVLESLATGGGTVATIDGSGGLELTTVAGWLAGPAGRSVRGRAGVGGADGAALQAQPSPAGDGLAMVIADAAGDAAAIVILAVDDGHELARFELPTGANRAVVGWLAGP